MVVMPFSMGSLSVKKVRKRILNQRSKDQGIGSALVATTISPGGKHAMHVIKRSLSAKLSRTVDRRSSNGSKKTELEEEEKEAEGEGSRRI